MTTDHTVARYVEAGWGKEAQAFCNYMNAIDQRIQSICGLGLDDLPDYDFASAYEDGVRSDEVAQEVLCGAGWLI